jgi:hypothetical protein
MNLSSFSHLPLTTYLKLSLAVVISSLNVSTAHAQTVLNPKLTQEVKESTIEDVRNMWAKAKMPKERTQCLNAWADEGSLITLKAFLESLTALNYENERKEASQLLRKVKSTPVLIAGLLSGVGEKSGQAMLVQLLAERADQAVLNQLTLQYESGSLPQPQKNLILTIIETVRNPTLRPMLISIQERSLNRAPDVTLWPSATFTQIDNRASTEALAQAATKALAGLSSSVSTSH